MKKSRSIAWKLSSLIITLFLVLFIIYSALTSIDLYKQSIRDSETSTLHNAELSAAKMKERFMKANNTLQTTKRIFETMHTNGSLSATEILRILEKNLTDSKDVLGVAAVLENRSVQIEPILSSNLTDSGNRFIPYLSKNGDGVLTTAVEGYEDEQTADWYRIPKKEGKAVLTEPYEYEVNGNKVTMTTLAVPLVSSSGAFFGVLTADLSVDFLTDLVNSITPEGGYAGIITETGMVIANSINPKLNTTKMQDAIDWTSIKNTLETGMPDSTYVPSIQLGEQSFNAFAPMILEGIEDTWARMR